ncbi:hypothetical protein OB446_027005 [Paenibacillus alvei]|uniref:hypothetical protein n=1 Tax=Paenibacillus alvei TaxID=44250 RepID=UPI000287C870|nr:hypothetical protein [Paenibacillus alvei]EJW13925.1 hypothetical protein PAV_141p00310 [Paenibacillus alvei DSM 29]MCY9707711.1 hypothetical protein [Paenibacillus alvei]MEC0082776.1 hypothetical protein [Paenibacillus alvei]
MSIQVPVEVTNCDQCPYAEARKVWTADSWEDVRAIKCKQLGRDVYEYLDWYDKSPVPDECPFKRKG